MVIHHLPQNSCSSEDETFKKSHWAMQFETNQIYIFNNLHTIHHKILVAVWLNPLKKKFLSKGCVRNTSLTNISTILQTYSFSHLSSLFHYCQVFGDFRRTTDIIA